MEINRCGNQLYPMTPARQEYWMRKTMNMRVKYARYATRNPGNPVTDRLWGLVGLAVLAFGGEFARARRR